MGKYGENLVCLMMFKKENRQRVYFKKNKESLLEDYLEQELVSQERFYFKTNNFVLLIPFWDVCSYVTMITPKRIIFNTDDLKKVKLDTSTEVISKITKGDGKLFNYSFSYSSEIY